MHPGLALPSPPSAFPIPPPPPSAANVLHRQPIQVHHPHQQHGLLRLVPANSMTGAAVGLLQQLRPAAVAAHYPQRQGNLYQQQQQTGPLVRHSMFPIGLLPAEFGGPASIPSTVAMAQQTAVYCFPSSIMENGGAANIPPACAVQPARHYYQPPPAPHQHHGPPMTAATFVPMPVPLHPHGQQPTAGACCPLAVQLPPPSSAADQTHTALGTPIKGTANCQNTGGGGTAAGQAALPQPAAENNAGGGGDCWSTAVTGWEQAAMIKNKVGLLINGRFQIIQSIASGSYGEIFAAEDLQSAGPKRQRVAVKFDGACRDNHLRYEYQVYKSALYEDGNGKVEGFPQVHWYGHEYGHNIMVMELLGAPVASLFAFCDRKFARQTIVSLGEQMIHRIRHLHQRGFIHRDIKPENFLMGLAGRESSLYLIDFGLARRYRYREGENRQLTHIPFRRGRSFIGTAKYASLNSHKSIELSRRDDLESLAYVLIELISGHLPWKNISKRNATTRHQASQKIRQLKEQTHWEQFCPYMAQFIRYCREISFNEEPDYDKLLDLLQLIAVPDFSTPCSSASLPVHYHHKQQNQQQESNNSRAERAICCQTPETSEKMTQVDLEGGGAAGQRQGEEEEGEGEEEGAEGTTGQEEQKPSEQNVSDVSVTKLVQSGSLQRLSLTISSEQNNNASDFDEIGAATTTTSCSENELDIAADGCGEEGGELAGAGGGISTRSGTGTADDEDSQPTPQQEQQQVCRKCRRLRDQSHLQQQKKRATTQQQQQKAVEQQQKQRVELGLQTDYNEPARRVRMVAIEPGKMCWQRARESNPERRFQYENKFSWTLSAHQHEVGALIPAQQKQAATIYGPPAEAVHLPFLAGGPTLPLLPPSIPPHLLQNFATINNRLSSGRPNAVPPPLIGTFVPTQPTICGQQFPRHPAEGMTQMSLVTTAANFQQNGAANGQIQQPILLPLPLPRALPAKQQRMEQPQPQQQRQHQQLLHRPFGHHPVGLPPRPPGTATIYGPPQPQNQGQAQPKRLLQVAFVLPPQMAGESANMKRGKGEEEGATDRIVDG